MARTASAQNCNAPLVEEFRANEYATADYATRFTIEFSTDRSTAVVTGVPASPSRPTAPVYVITKCTSQVELDQLGVAYPGAHVFVAHPENEVSTTSTTHIPLVKAIRLASLVAVYSSGYLTDVDVLNHVATLNDDATPGRFTEHDGNYTLVLENHPSIDVVLLDILSMPTGLEGRMDMVLWLEEALEAHPLGRWEWIKVIGLLLDSTSVALSEYNRVRSNYMTARALATDSVNKGDGYKPNATHA